MEAKTLNNIIQNNEVREFLIGKTNKEKSEIKCAKICLDYKTNLLNKKNIFEKDDIKIEIVGEIKKIEVKGHVGVEVFAKGWKNGKQCGFGKDGSVEIERFRIFNPPVLIQDPDGLIIQEWEDINGIKKSRRLTENPLLAIQETVWDNVKTLGKITNFEKGKIGSTVSTFYPDANPETTSVDGEVGKQYGSSWADTRDNTTGGASSDSATTMFLRTMKDGTTVSRYGVYRNFLLFDTSAIPDSDNIDSATLDLYKESNTGQITTFNCVLVDVNPASNTALSTADYDALTLNTPTELATRKSAGDFSTSSYVSWSLNANGLAAISKTGITKLGIRTEYDVDNIPPANNTYYGIWFYTADQTGSSNDPKLVVTHSSGASTFIPLIIMS